MATFQKLTDVAVTEAISEEAKVFIEDGGELKRVAKSQVGGKGTTTLAGMDDVICFYMKDLGGTSGYTTDNVKVSCNKTFDETLNLIVNHELKMITALHYIDYPWGISNMIIEDLFLLDADGDKVFDNSAEYIIFCGEMRMSSGSSTFYWHVTKDNQIVFGMPGVGRPE